MREISSYPLVSFGDEDRILRLWFCIGPVCLLVSLSPKAALEAPILFFFLLRQGKNTSENCTFFID